MGFERIAWNRFLTGWASLDELAGTWKNGRIGRRGFFDRQSLPSHFAEKGRKNRLVIAAGDGIVSGRCDFLNTGTSTRSSVPREGKGV